MSKYFGGESFWLLAGVFILGIFLGVNWTLHEMNTKYIWPNEKDGLSKLNELMKNDKSSRQGVIAMTEKRVYAMAVDGAELPCRCGVEK